MIKKVNVLGVSFSNLSIKESTIYVKTMMKKGIVKPFHIITANPEIVMQINRDKDFKRIEQSSGMVTADGIGIILGSKILKNKIDYKVTGVEFLIELLNMCENEKYSVFLLGADEKTNRLFEQYVKTRYPKLVISGRHNGYFDIHSTAVMDQINSTNTDFLVMGMGSPRAHKWFDAHRSDLKIKATIDVGGGFDALTGKVKRAPKLIRQLNLEWLYRRFQDPSRAKRQKDLYRFVGEVIKERFRLTKKYK